MSQDSLYDVTRKPVITYEENSDSDTHFIC